MNWEFFTKLNRQGILFLFFLLLLGVYAFTIFNIQSIYSIPSAQYPAIILIPKTDNSVSNFILGNNTDNSRFAQLAYSDNTLAIIELTISNTPIPTITYTQTFTPTLKPTVKPTTTTKPIPTSTKAPTKTPIPTFTPTLGNTQIPIPTGIPTSTPTIVPTILTIDYSKPWQVAAGCPSSTQNCVPCTSGSTCRFETGNTHGFQGWACQNNNPGNIRPSNSYNDTNDFRNTLIKSQGGTPSCGIRTGTGGSYMVFSDFNTGKNSLKAYLKAIAAGKHYAYTDCGSTCTMTYFCNKWANNPSSGYLSRIGSQLGIDMNITTLKSMVDTRLDDLANAIQTAEGFCTQRNPCN